MRLQNITRCVPINLTAGLAAMLASQLSVAADSRFGDGEGSAMGGSGSLGQASVAVHHNLIPSERKEIDDEIARLRREINDLRSVAQAARQEARGGIDRI